MKSKFREAISYLLLTGEKLSLESRLFFYSLLVTLLITLIAIIIGTVLSLPLYLRLTGFTIFVVLGLIYHLARVRKNIKPFIIVFVHICLLANVAIFIFGGGINAQNVIIMAFTFILSLIILPTKRRIYVLLAFLLLTVFCYLLQLYKPGIITTFHSEKERWTDGLTTTLYSIVVLYVIVQFLLKNYSNEKKRAEENEKMLQDLNKTLELRIEERTAELLESKDKFRALLNSTAEGIYGMDLNGCFTFVNNSCLKILGYNSEEELLGKPVHPTIHHSWPDGTPYLAKDCRLHKALEDQTGSHADDEILWTAGRTMIPVEFWSYPILVNGKIVGAVVTFFNITERKKAEEELKIAKLEAEVANRAKSEFLLNISHEFRTPLNAVIGYADLLESADERARKEYAESIKASGRRLLEMVSGILEIVRSERAELMLELDFVETYPFFRNLEKYFAPAVAEKGLNFISELAPDLPGMIYVDYTKLRQVITNLVNNSIKFTERGDITLKVYQARNDTGVNIEKTNLIIEVKDTGKGIPEDYQKKIFEAFSQVERKSGLSGVGLGLTLTNRLVSLMNGTIKVISQPGMGSRFTIYLRDLTCKESTRSDVSFEITANPDNVALEINKEEISDLNGLISELEGKYIETWGTFGSKQPIGELIKFGKALRELGIAHNCLLISDYGNKLTESANHLDIESIIKLIPKFPEILKILRY